MSDSVQHSCDISPPKTQTLICPIGHGRGEPGGSFYLPGGSRANSRIPDEGPCVSRSPGGGWRSPTLTSSHVVSHVVSRRRAHFPIVIIYKTLRPAGRSARNWPGHPRDCTENCPEDCPEDCAPPSPPLPAPPRPLAGNGPPACNLDGRLCASATQLKCAAGRSELQPRRCAGPLQAQLAGLCASRLELCAYLFFMAPAFFFPKRAGGAG